MANEQNLIPFQPGQSGNPAGYKPGVKNRSTIARKILEMKGLFTNERFEQLQKQFPEITKQMTVEEIMTIVQADKAVKEQDTNAYKVIMDSAYGMPKQELDSTIKGTIVLSVTNEDLSLGDS